MIISDKGGNQQIFQLWFIPFNWASAAFQAVSAVSASFGNMGAHTAWLFTCSTDCWIAQGTAPTASKAAGSMFVAKGQQVFIDGDYGPNVAVLQDSAAGNASLVPVTT